jgi:hypothetical protein
LLCRNVKCPMVPSLDNQVAFLGHSKGTPEPVASFWVFKGITVEFS